MGTRYEVGDTVERKARGDERAFTVTDIDEPDSKSPTYVLKPVGKEDGKFEEYANASDIQRREPDIYAVYYVKSTPAGGDRREIGRYKAYRMPDVEEAVKQDMMDEIPPDLQGEGDGVDTTYLTWTERPPQEETDLSDEEYQKALDYGELDTVYTLEIQKDNSASFPMKLISGGMGGRDLTE